MALGAMILALMTSQVGAQAPNAAQVSNQTSMDLQEVLVSATKRLEDIQDVPLSVTAFSAAQLEAKGVEAGFGRIDSSYIGASFSANNGELHPLRRPGYSITDLRLGMRRDRYQADAFVTNLTDERANLADAVLIGAELPGQPRFLINQPRTVGIEARIRFQ